MIECLLVAELVEVWFLLVSPKLVLLKITPLIILLGSKSSLFILFLAKKHKKRKKKKKETMNRLAKTAVGRGLFNVKGNCQ